MYIRRVTDKMITEKSIYVIDLSWSKYYNNSLDRKVFDRHKVLFNVFCTCRISFKSLPNIKLLLLNRSKDTLYNNFIVNTTINLCLEINCFVWKLIADVMLVMKHTNMIFFYKFYGKVGVTTDWPLTKTRGQKFEILLDFKIKSGQYFGKEHCRWKKSNWITQRVTN